MAHTLTIVEPIWPMLQNLSKTLGNGVMHVQLMMGQAIRLSFKRFVKKGRARNMNLKDFTGLS